MTSPHPSLSLPPRAGRCPALPPTGLQKEAGECKEQARALAICALPHLPPPIPKTTCILATQARTDRLQSLDRWSPDPSGTRRPTRSAGRNCRRFGRRRLETVDFGRHRRFLSGNAGRSPAERRTPENAANFGRSSPLFCVLRNPR